MINADPTLTSMLPFLSDEDIVGLNLPLDDVLWAVQTALVEHAKGETEMPPKQGVHPLPDTFLHAMPAWIPALKACGMKWVSGFPMNADRKLPTIAGLLVMNDPDTGLPTAIMDAGWITGIRTAMVSALIIRECAHEEVSVLGLAGCGMQGRCHLRCVNHVRPNIKCVRLYDVYPDAARSLLDEARGYMDAQIEVVDSPEDCLRGVDLAVTCTSGTLELQDAWLPPGGTAVGVDSRVAWWPSFKTIDKFIMDDEAQARTFEKRGKYPGGLPPIYAELGDILNGKKPGRENDDERVLGLPLGLAITDVALGKVILDRVGKTAACT